MKKSLRLLLVGWLALALAGLVALGGTSASASPSPALSVSSGASSAPSAEVSRRAFCTDQVATVEFARVDVKRWRGQIAKDDATIKIAKRAIAKAIKSGNAAAEAKARRILNRAKMLKVRHGRNLAYALRVLEDAKEALADCLDIPVGPLQPVCDEGLRQAVCDALALLPDPDGDGEGLSPIQPLCEIGLPQAICDAANAPPGDNTIQPLCDEGLQEGICDFAYGYFGYTSLPIAAGLPGLPDYDFPGVPDAPVVDTLIQLYGSGGVIGVPAVCFQQDLEVICDQFPS